MGLGSTISPTSFASLGQGLMQTIQAKGLKKDADAAFPALQDPQQMAFLSELNQKRKAMDSGAEFASGMNSIGASTTGTNNSIVQAGGGNVGATMQSLLQSQRVGQDAQNRVLANGQQQ